MGTYQDIYQIFIAVHGADQNEGTRTKPIATIEEAKKRVRAIKENCNNGLVEVIFLEGTYYLEETIVFEAQDSGSSEMPITYKAEGHVTLSGGRRLFLDWVDYRDGIVMATIPEGLAFDQLYVNDQRQRMARYPSYQEHVKYFHGFKSDAFDGEKARDWKSTEGAYMHTIHRHMWGGSNFKVLGKDEQGELIYEGGWQNNRAEEGIHPHYRYVENIFEELTDDHEWYLDQEKSILYYKPAQGVDMSQAKVECGLLKNLIDIKGDDCNPVSYISIEGFQCKHTARTFMDTDEPLLRSDWRIYRGGAIYITGGEHITIGNMHLDAPGGNGIFVSGYNENVDITGCHISHTGACAIAFVGYSDAVRSPLFNYHEKLALEDADHGIGPKSNNYPRNCSAYNNLIHDIGEYEKQTAGVQISMAMDITVSHNTIYRVPRVGINVSEGTWGGHIIEYNDVFDTVRETGDHGAFNSWGRDRFWYPNRNITNEYYKKFPEMVTWDCVKMTHIRNNRMECSNGWDIDLDDGSSHYKIYNNLCLRGGIKTREGYSREVYNNIMVNNTIRCPISYDNAGDYYHHNIVFRAYDPTDIPEEHGKTFDYNFLHIEGSQVEPASVLQSSSHQDEHTLQGDAMFMKLYELDYSLDKKSPVLELGFTDIPMDEFGVVSEHLRAIAESPADMKEVEVDQGVEVDTYICMEAIIKNISGLDELSAIGRAEAVGVLIVKVPIGSHGEKFGLQPWDVITHVNTTEVESVEHYMKLIEGLINNEESTLHIWRNQSETCLSFTPQAYSRHTYMPVPMI